MATARRSHTKSRNGCSSCRERKIKCDENAPCTRCQRRGIVCSLSASETPLPISRNTEPSPTRSRPEEEEAAVFKPQDFALFNHFTTSTALTIARPPIHTSPWVTLVPNLAPQHPYLLHGVLAVASAHLGVLEPDKAQSHMRIAAEHQSKALRLFRAALDSVSPERAVPTFLCSALFWIYYFTTAADPAHLLFNPERPSPPDWMLPIRGCHALYDRNTVSLRTANILADPWIETDDDELLAQDFPSKEALADLRNRLPLPLDDRDMYEADLETLAASFAVSDKEGGCRRTAPLKFAAGATAGFLDRLAAKQQPALVMMVFWCVLMHRIDRVGWIGNERAREMAAVLLRFLTPESMELVRWPIRQIGGLAVD